MQLTWSDIFRSIWQSKKVNEYNKTPAYFDTSSLRLVHLLTISWNVLKIKYLFRVGLIEVILSRFTVTIAEVVRWGMYHSTENNLKFSQRFNFIVNWQKIKEIKINTTHWFAHLLISIGRMVIEMASLISLFDFTAKS